MKRALFILLSIIRLQAMAQLTSSFSWAASMSGTNVSLGQAIAVDKNAGVYSCGYFNGVVDFDPGVSTHTMNGTALDNSYLCRLDVNGQFLWAKNPAAGSTSYASAICVDASGNCYVAGSFSGSVDLDPGLGTHIYSSGVGLSTLYISKFDVMGNLKWAKVIDGSSSLNYVGGIALDKLGHVYITGSFSDVCDFDPSAGTYTLGFTDSFYPNQLSCFVLKLSTSGSFVWARQFADSTETTQPYGIRADSAGAVYISGEFSGVTDFDPGPSTYTLGSLGVTDIFVSKLSSSGDFAWARQVGSPGNNSNCARNLDIDRFENVYTCGFFSGSADFDPGPGISTLNAGANIETFVLKLDSAGQYAWAGKLGDSGIASIQNLALDTAGNIILVGDFKGNNQDLDPGPGTFTLSAGSDYNGFILKLDHFGQFIWGGRLYCDSTHNISAVALAIDEPGNIYTTGFYNGTANFDPFGSYPLTSLSPENIFIERIGQCYVPGPPLNTTPAAGQIICKDNLATLSASAHGPINWYTSATSDTLIHTGPDYNNISLPVGTYTFYLSTGGCTNSLSRTAITLTVDACLGIPSTGAETGITFYPNPSTGIVNLDLPASLLPLEAEVYATSGELLIKQMIGNAHLDLGHLPAGLYLVKLVKDSTTTLAVRKIQKL